MKKLVFIFLLFILFMLSACAVFQADNETDGSSLLDSESLTREYNDTSNNDSLLLREPQSKIVDLDKEETETIYDFVDLGNLGQTEHYPNSKVGDTINGFLITQAYTRKLEENGDLISRLVVAAFQGETVLETLFLYDDSVTEGLYPPHQINIASSLTLPCFENEESNMDTIYINSAELDEELEKQWQSMKKM